MMRRLGLAAFLLIACFGVAPASAFDIEVVNRSAKTLHHLFLTDGPENSFGDDQLGDDADDVVDPGDSTIVEDVDPGRYDVKVVASDGATCVFHGLDVKADITWTVTQTFLDACR